MAYNGFYQSPYQPYTQPTYQPATPQNQANTGLIWIQGEAAAKSYLVAPNTTVVLFDSESQTVYLKSADAAGMPSMRILDYTIRDQKAHSGVFDKQAESYATKDDVDALRAEIEQIQARLKGAGNESTVQRHAE
jgi:hypothetical protein